MVPPTDPARMQETCESYDEFHIDGRLAINCVSCGRAACRWGVVVPGPRVFTILSRGREGEESHPSDGRFPIRSIINSFRWHPRTANVDQLADPRVQRTALPAPAEPPGR